MKILLVDDEPALRELLRATLESVEITVDEAESGPEAETRVRAMCERLLANPLIEDYEIEQLDGAA